jgi:hypothetical protein
MRRSVMLMVVMLSALAMYATAASATVVHICVPEKAGTAITSNGTAEACKEKETGIQLPASATEQKTLISILPYITFKSAGVDSKPTILFSKANIQVVNGEGKTATDNGEGNIVIGYNETPGTETGSHNLVLGGTQDYTSYADILGGTNNTATAPFVTLFGEHNSATLPGKGALVAGHYNAVAQEFGSITGGCGNGVVTAPDGAGACEEGEQGSSVTGGRGNWASGGKDDEISGGQKNRARAEYTAILGGYENETTGKESTVSGGTGGKSIGIHSSVSGGGGNAVDGEGASISGGQSNTAGGEYSSVTGGSTNGANGQLSVVVGGKENIAGAFGGGGVDAILGGAFHNLAGNFETFPE